ncbi:head-tail connector protein [Paracoccus sp. ME4]|uniref:head-tail connector protein n=1 Tax=Paracoccus sp. ME4 TaxID=3138066 RepID=UPI00398B28D2
MIPHRTTDPSQPIVDLDEMKAHLRVEDDDENLLIQSLVDAATGYLDGYSGVLGRAIMEQTWTINVDGPGEYLLPLPDVKKVEASAGTVVLRRDGACVIAIADQPCAIHFTCALPNALLPAIRQAVKLLAGHWYHNREAVSAVDKSHLPLSVDALLGAARWSRI